MADYSGLERRCGKDRRIQNLPITKRLFFKGSRTSGRRREDRTQVVLLDRYKPSLVMITALILGLSLLDAILTLTLISKGAHEVNPFMRYCLGHGAHAFLLVKYSLTALSALIIVICHEAIVTRYRLASGILPFFATAFGCVVVWEFYLLSIAGCR